MDISDEDTKYLNDPAKTELRTCVQSYLGELLREANRLEAGERTTSGDPEITSSMVKDAAILLKREYKKPRKSGWNIWHGSQYAQSQFDTLGFLPQAQER